MRSMQCQYLQLEPGDCIVILFAISTALTFDFSKADQSNLSTYLDNIDYFSLFDTCADTASIVDTFYSVLYNAFNKFVPVRKSNNSFHSRTFYTYKIRKRLNKRLINGVLTEVSKLLTFYIGLNQSLLNVVRQFTIFTWNVKTESLNRKIQAHFLVMLIVSLLVNLLLAAQDYKWLTNN